MSKLSGFLACFVFGTSKVGVAWGGMNRARDEAHFPITELGILRDPQIWAGMSSD